MTDDDDVTGDRILFDLLKIQEQSLKSLKEGKCSCWRCTEEREEIRVTMIVCPICRNKRCPKASDHRLECTNSNEPGQPGSVYE